MTVVLAQQTRAAGTLTSAAAPTARFDGKELTATALLAPADLADNTLTVTLAVEANDQPSGNPGGWYLLIETVWTGGSTDRSGNPVPCRLSFTSENVAARRLRGRMTWNKTVSIGLDVTVTA